MSDNVHNITDLSTKTGFIKKIAPKLVVVAALAAPAAYLTFKAKQGSVEG